MPKRGAPRAISPALGLHNQGKCFQLRWMKEQSEAVCEHLANLVRNTEAEAPIRDQDKTYRLSRQLRKMPQLEERRLEAAIWKRWGPTVTTKQEEFLPDVCRYIQTFQMPLYAYKTQKHWKAVDLVGVSPKGLPVIMELKKGGSAEPPLRMLVEAAAYGIAIRTAWNNGHLARDWRTEVKSMILPENREMDLQTITLVCLAPAGYWQACIGPSDKQSRRKVKREAWASFHKVVNAFNGHGFPAHFIQFDEQPQKDTFPIVGNPRKVELPE